MTGIFLDTTVLKASLDTQRVFLRQSTSLRWGDHDLALDVHRPVFVNPNTKYLDHGNRSRFYDTISLRFVAALAREEQMALLIHREVIIESWRLPRMNGPRFYGVPLQEVEDPFPCDRVIVDGTGVDHQTAFFSQVRHQRFLALQRACGAFQGADRPPQRNQLMDAFHILCAEQGGATFFLTLDDRLIRTLKARRVPVTSVIPITPTRLIESLLCTHPTWLWCVLKEGVRLARSTRRLGDPVQDALGWF